MQACEAADDLPDDEPCTLLDFYGLPPSPDRCAIMTEQAWRQLQDKKAPRNGISGLIVDELPERFDFTAAGCSVVPISDLRWPESMVMVATAPEWARLWSNDVARLWRDWPGVPAESISLVLMNGTMRLKVQRAALTSENDLLRLWDTGALLLATTHGR